MKKIFIVILVVFSLFPLFAQENSDSYFLPDPEVNFSSHLYGETVMLYGYPTIGGGWDMGLQVDTVNIS